MMDGDVDHRLGFVDLHGHPDVGQRDLVRAQVHRDLRRIGHRRDRVVVFPDRVVRGRGGAPRVGVRRSFGSS